MSLPRKTLSTLASAFGVALLLPALTVQAGTSTSSLGISATVTATCTITTSSAIAFGNYDPLVANAAAPLNATGALSVACTKGAPGVKIALGTGANAAAGSTCTAPSRNLSDGTNLLPYALYRDAGRTQPWGCDTSAGGNALAYTPASKAAALLTVYAQIPAGLDASVGAYADTVVATISF